MSLSGTESIPAYGGFRTSLDIILERAIPERPLFGCHREDDLWYGVLVRFSKFEHVVIAITTNMRRRGQYGSLLNPTLA